ncbi:CRISPR-associated endoribonuclease Cas2 [wastewater metagenome]|uniref:CRISPR-associated endoribonuclease Cas2 n=2 Tax=unclassified sequences TaxID=12908 RepID=A0A5B8RJ37_9ZZZZ|nr:CRISPR-associated endoribonuclease Cas2 [uncultured organism]
MGDDRSGNYLVCYDIRDPKRLRRVHRCMRGWGLPLQYSVFYCRLTPALRKALIAELRERIDDGADDVRIYSMQSRGTIHFQGRSPLPEGLNISGLRLQRDESGSQL